MPPSKLGPQVSAVTRTAVRAISSSRSAAFSTRAILRTCLPLTWVSMASRAPSSAKHEPANRSAWKPITPSTAARISSSAPRATRRALKNRRALFVRLANQSLLQREAGRGLEQ